MSTNVPLVSGAPVSGKSSWATYITADEMMFSIALGGFEDVPDESNFKAGINTGLLKFSLIDSNPEMATRRKAKASVRD